MRRSFASGPPLVLRVDRAQLRVYQILSKAGTVASPRPLIIGRSTGPQAPYPLRMAGKVARGFGRGSSELGIPTANLPVDDSTPWIANAESGAYFGWASVRLPPTVVDPSATASDTTSPSAHSTFSIYPMVMSIGYNPFYGNSVRSAEVHILHEFGTGLYGVEMRLLVLDFIRAERDYPNQQALIDDIEMDIAVARRSLARDAWSLRETGHGTLDGSWLVCETVEVEENDGEV